MCSARRAGELFQGVVDVMLVEERLSCKRCDDTVPRYPQWQSQGLLFVSPYDSSRPPNRRRARVWA
jgi:hypothetical protein